jgi:pilus assembly protein TadC
VNPERAPSLAFYRGTMVRLILFLLVVWVVLSVLGFVIKGLFWLAIVGIVLFLVTGLWGVLTGRKSSN